MRRSTLDNSERSPDRRGEFIFLARMAVLVVATGVLLAYGLSQAWQRLAGPSTSALVTTPLTPRPELSATLSAGPDATGVLTEDVQVVSEDGLATLSLPRGTKVLDAQGQPLASITVTSPWLEVASETYARVGEGYEFGPEGATLDPPASLTINYDPHASFPFTYQDVDTTLVYLTYMGEEGLIRPALASVDGQTASITAKIDHLGTMVLYCEVHYYPMS